MKVLLVSYWFPPANTMAAIRIGKLAKYLDDAGHDVRVLAARSPEDPSLPVELPEDRVIRTRYWEVDHILDPITRPLRRVAQALFWLGGKKSEPVQIKGSAPSDAPMSIATAIRWHYHALMQMPDSRIGWRGYALDAARRLMASWRPDIIVASAPPFTCLVVARRLGREFDVPWVAEFRDIWVDNPYNTDPIWRQRIDRVVERAILNSADGIVTVTPIWSEVVERQYGHPVTTILNGYAEEDRVEPSPAAPSETVSIVYTGGVYPGFRDPSPLFAAIALLDDRRRHVEVLFYGPEADDVMPLAESHGVADRVFVRPRVGHRESLRIQATADVLLLMQWNDAKDEGNIPGKFFEYLGARRPILMLGYEQGILARMIRERGAGFVANTPHQIAPLLEAWIAQRPTGIPLTDASALVGLSRAEQYRSYEEFLAAVIEKRRRHGERAAQMHRHSTAGSGG